MLIYHGTTEAAARKALKKGLLPREMSAVGGNWRHTISSNPAMVYLSLSYAPYYAVSALINSDAGRMAIIELDTQKLEQKRLRPDEDFVEQCLRDAPKALAQFHLENAGIKKRQHFVRKNLDRWHELWPQCLEHFGNICYKGAIDPSAITRIVAYKTEDNPAATWFSMEPTITIANYKFCGGTYRALTKFFIGDEVKPEDLLMRVPEGLAQDPAHVEVLARAKIMIDTRNVETIYESAEALRLAKESEASEKALYDLV